MQRVCKQSSKRVSMALVSLGDTRAHLASLGRPYCIISSESSAGINPSCVPFTSSSRQLGWWTMPVSTREKVFWEWSLKSSTLS